MNLSDEQMFLQYLNTCIEGECNWNWFLSFPTMSNWKRCWSLWASKLHVSASNRADTRNLLIRNMVRIVWNVWIIVNTTTLKLLKHSFYWGCRAGRIDCICQFWFRKQENIPLDLNEEMNILISVIQCGKKSMNPMILQIWTAKSPRVQIKLILLINQQSRADWIILTLTHFTSFITLSLSIFSINEGKWVKVRITQSTLQQSIKDAMK